MVQKRGIPSKAATTGFRRNKQKPATTHAEREILRRDLSSAGREDLALVSVVGHKVLLQLCKWCDVGIKEANQKQAKGEGDGVWKPDKQFLSAYRIVSTAACNVATAIRALEKSALERMGAMSTDELKARGLAALKAQAEAEKADGGPH